MPGLDSSDGAGRQDAVQRSEKDSMDVAAPPSPDVLPVLSGLLRDAVLLVERGTATPADIDIAMRLGAGHPAGPFAVMAALTVEDRARMALDLPVEVDGGARVDPPLEAWRGPVGVVGSGHMACGIVEAVARSGRPVRVLVRSGESGTRLREKLAASLRRAVSRGRLDATGQEQILDRVSVTEEPQRLAGSDIVIEAVAEDLDAKAGVVARLDAVLPPSLPVATNTSSFRVADLRPFVSAGRPVIALHFFNPAQVMKLVEVVVPSDLPGAEDLRAAATAWARELGRTPIACTDSRGFVVNRLLIPFLNDAVRLHENGMPATEVDDRLITGAGHPMGPLALIDLIGLDATVAALESMAAVENDPPHLPRAALRELVAAGRLGRKSGAGFHSYS
jgi:3-hydroxybutyryl-CoA dehydrogenase